MSETVADKWPLFKVAMNLDIFSPLQVCPINQSAAKLEPELEQQSSGTSSDSDSTDLTYSFEKSQRSGASQNFLSC